MVQLLDGNSAEIVLRRPHDEQPSVQPAETGDETNFDNTEIERDLLSMLRVKKRPTCKHSNLDTSKSDQLGYLNISNEREA